MGLTRKGEPGTWLPVSIERLVALLENGIVAGRGYGHVYALRRNLAYSLQHVEFLEQTITDLKLTTVLLTQTWKTQIVVGCGVIECLLHYLIVSSGNESTTEWEVKHEFTGVNKTIDGQVFRVDSVLRRRLEVPQAIPMVFDSMLKKAESKKLLGPDHSLYAKLKKLRPLRNRVHLQEIAAAGDHDFNAFSALDQKLMMQALHAVFTGPLFSPSATQRKYFSYLESYLDTT